MEKSSKVHYICMFFINLIAVSCALIRVFDIANPEIVMMLLAIIEIILVIIFVYVSVRYHRGIFKK